jgi:hypothetical protein
MRWEELMKKTLNGVVGVAALVIPFVVYAVTWEADSNYFNFPETGIKTTVGPIPLSAVRCQVENRSGIVTIRYTVPSSVRNARMNIFTIAGAQVAAFNLQSGSNSIQWSTAAHPVAAGVYWSVIRCGSVEKMTKISIVK